MSVNVRSKWLSWGSIGILLILGAYWLYPYLLYHVMTWQKAFNLQLSSSLNQLSQQQHSAGITLVIISFFYGVFHAVGPGHGKFILTSYLSLEETKLKQAVKLSLTASLVQGLVAVALVSVIVVAFTLSRTYFNLTLQWVERASFAMMIILGLYWCFQAWKARRKPKATFKIQAVKNVQKNVKIQPLAHHTSHCLHNEHCGCGHQHLPSQAQMQQATHWKTQLLLILSIGARPCSGAILVLFLSYTLNIYAWGMLSAIVMAVGTGLTLTLFAFLVIWARVRAIRLSRWYLSHSVSQQSRAVLKFGLGTALIIFGVLLLHSSFIDVVSTNIFKR